MSKIRILSEHLANQIAAGEVIERPASVVKELLENSIDAEAGRVQIEIAGSGTKLIKVIDDGTGMDKDDALLCLERHATSKLTGKDDGAGLAAIRSLGFRGEAIPSIASVAKMSLTTRTGNDPLGTRIEVRYGKVLKVHETGCNKGTVVEIKDLFGNVPARKKFLKSSRTELYHIEEVIKNYALADPGLGLTYRVDNNTVLDLPARTDSLEDRVRLLSARGGAATLIALRQKTTGDTGPDRIKVAGYLLAPEQSYGTPNRLRLFVNNRAVKDRMMAHAVAEGLAGYLMKGRTAAGAVFVAIPHEAVDVNVHPAKQEIRFREPDLIHAAIVAAVRRGLDQYQQTTRQAIFGGGHDLPVKTEKHPGPMEKTGPKGPKSRRLWKSLARDSARDQAVPSFSPPAPPEPAPPESFFSRETAGVRTATAEPAAVFAAGEEETPHLPEILRPIGQFLDLYLLCEARSGSENYLVVIDQHAVHERILFENLKQQYGARQMARQSLLFPKMMELEPEYGVLLEKHREEIERFGLVVEEFGGNSYVIKAVPAVVSHLAPEEILTGILMEFGGPDYDQDQKRKRSDAARLDDILSSMACKAAIKAGQNLNGLEMRELLRLMRKSKAFTHCPHGRPVVRLFSGTDIKKWFHRT